jgi:hypothetical protein
MGDDAREARQRRGISMTTLAKSDPNRAGRRPDALLADLGHGRYGG